MGSREKIGHKNGSRRAGFHGRVQRSWCPIASGLVDFTLNLPEGKFVLRKLGQAGKLNFFVP